MAEDKTAEIAVKRTELPPAGPEEMVRNINPQAFRPETMARFKREVSWTKADENLNGSADPNSIQNRYNGGLENEDKESQDPREP